jgi:hypothetical protein
MWIGATWCVVGGLAAAAGIRNPVGLTTPSEGGAEPAMDAGGESFHCALDAAPLTVDS